MKKALFLFGLCLFFAACGAKTILESLYPQQNGRVLSLLPKFEWEAIDGALSYEIQVAEDQAFTTSVQQRRTRNPFTRFENPLANGRTYYWRIKASYREKGSPRLEGAIGAAYWKDWSDVLAFTTSLPELGALYPGRDERIPTLHPVFEWEAIEGAEEYEFEVAQDSEFASVVRRGDVVVPSFELEENEPAVLQDEGGYFWRIKGRVGERWTDWSEPAAFAIDLPLEKPRLAQPADRTIVTDASFELAWDAVEGAAGYRLQVCTRGEFTRDTMIVDEAGIPGTVYSVDRDTGNETLFWRVAAQNADRYRSVWSDTRTLMVRLDHARFVLTVRDGGTPAYYSVYYPTSGWKAKIIKSRTSRSYYLGLSNGTTSIEVPHMSGRGLGEGITTQSTMVSAGPIELERIMYSVGKRNFMLMYIDQSREINAFMESLASGSLVPRDIAVFDEMMQTLEIVGRPEMESFEADFLGYSDARQRAETAVSEPFDQRAIKAVANDTDVRVRTKPTTKGSGIIDSLDKGTVVTVLGKSKNEERIGSMSARWYRIRTIDGAVGYSYGYFYDVDEDELKVVPIY